jgi:hypothetical protein
MFKRGNAETLLSNSSISKNSTFVQTDGYDSLTLTLSFNSSAGVSWTPTILGYNSTSESGLTVYEGNSTISLGSSALTIPRMIRFTGPLPNYISLSAVPSSSPLTAGLLTATYQLSKI